MRKAGWAVAVAAEGFVAQSVNTSWQGIVYVSGRQTARGLKGKMKSMAAYTLATISEPEALNIKGTTKALGCTPP